MSSQNPKATSLETLKYLIDVSSTRDAPSLATRLSTQFESIALPDWVAAAEYSQSRIRSLDMQLHWLSTRLAEIPQRYLMGPYPARIWSAAGAESYPNLRHNNSKEMAIKIVCVVSEREEKEMWYARMLFELFARFKTACDSGWFGVEPVGFMSGQEHGGRTE